MKERNRKALGTGRSFLFINSNPSQQLMIIDAVGTIAPKTQLFLAENAMEAIQVMVEKELIPDIIMIELKMKRIDALEFLRQIKKTFPMQNIPVIVHSKQCDDSCIRELKALGAHGFYFKSYDYERVCNIVNILVHEQFSICLN